MITETKWQEIEAKEKGMRKLCKNAQFVRVFKAKQDGCCEVMVIGRYTKVKGNTKPRLLDWVVVPIQ